MGHGVWSGWLGEDEHVFDDGSCEGKDEFMNAKVTLWVGLWASALEDLLSSAAKKGGMN